MKNIIIKNSMSAKSVLKSSSPSPDSSPAEVIVKMAILTTSPIPPAVIEMSSHGVFPYSLLSVATSPTEISGKRRIKIFPRLK
ncbi:MAG: hypothetical protein Q9M43_03010 [Sulfurimonas sp.]|nr:hypothetical protein [Sulfurimonas sp.]